MRSMMAASSSFGSSGFLDFVMQDHPATQQIYALIGRIATAWSEVELLWYLIFTVLMEETPREKVDVVYFQWDTNAKQRELIQAMADVAYPVGKDDRPHPMRRRLGQLHATTNDLAGLRNAAIHAILQVPISGAALHYGDDDFRILKGVNPRKPNKLAGRRVRDQLADTLSRIEKLAADLGEARDAIAPKLDVPPDMIAALRKLGFQVPPWIVERQADPAGPKRS